jgi:membrane-associated phospholipid phosphatase
VQSSTLTTFDHDVTSFVVSHRTPALDDAMKALTWLGSWLALLVVAGVTALQVARRRVPLIAVLFVLAAWAGELGAVTLAKAVVGRQRPPRDLWLVAAHGQSFPSGHTANAVVVCVMSALLVSSSVRTTPAKASTWAVAILAIVTVGFSRIELGVHWTTDVLASAVFVTVWMAIIAAWIPPADRNLLFGRE